MVSHLECDEDGGPASAPTILVEIDHQSNGPTALPAPPLVPYLFTAEQRLPRPSPVPADFAHREQIDHTVFYNAPPPSMKEAADPFRPTMMEAKTPSSPNVVITTEPTATTESTTETKATPAAAPARTRSHGSMEIEACMAMPMPLPARRPLMLVASRPSKRPTVRVTALMNASAVRRAFRPSSPPTMPPARAA